MFLRIASVLSVLFLVCGIQAEEHRGKIVKVEKDTLIVSVSSKGTIKMRMKIDPLAKTEFAKDDGIKILNIRAQEVKDDQTKKMILKEGEYVIIRTEIKDKKERVVSVHAVGG